MKNKKVIKANIVAIVVAILVGILTVIPVHLQRVKLKGGWHMNSSVLIASLMWIILVEIVAYIMQYSAYIRRILIDEANNDFLNMLKEKLSEEEKEVIYKYPTYDTLLIAILQYYKPIFYLKLEEKEKVILLIKDSATRELITKVKVGNLNYIKNNFKFSED